MNWVATDHAPEEKNAGQETSSRPPAYKSDLAAEYERFSRSRKWMPMHPCTQATMTENVCLMAALGR